VAALEWTFEQINFVAGRRGAVVTDDFYNKLEKLNVQAGKKGQNSVGIHVTWHTQRDFFHLCRLLPISN